METGRVIPAPFGRTLWLAMGFLTTLPLPALADSTSDLWPQMGRAARWFPVVGLVLGAILVALWWILRLLLPAPLVAVLLMVMWVLLTGGLHLDGLADCCDGLFAPVAAERRLEIMRDPRVGAFGVLGLVLHLLLKTTALSVVLVMTPWIVVGALLLSPTWARWHLVWCTRQPQARSDGMGARLSAYVTSGILWTAMIVPVVLSLAVGVTGNIGRMAGAVLAGWLASAVAVELTRRRLGGVTGDVFGMTVEVTEVAMLLVYAIVLPWHA